MTSAPAPFKSAEIANSTIVSSDIKDGAINSQDIRNSAVTGAKIKNYSVTSIDLLPNLNLGKAGDDGDFTVKDAGGAVGVRLNGDGANITNQFSGTPSPKQRLGEGLGPNSCRWNHPQLLALQHGSGRDPPYWNRRL